MPTTGLIIDVDSKSLTSDELENAFSILSNLPLEKFNNVKKTLNLTHPNAVGLATVAAFLKFCTNSGLDLSDEGVRQFKAAHPPLDPDKPILEKTAMAYYNVLGFDQNKSDSPWMDIAKAELSVKEFRDSADNPRIVEYHQSTNLSASDSRNDETPWCSSFVNWCMLKAGVKRTKSAWARSWLSWGEKIETPKYGCVVVLWRGSPESEQGHVGFFIKAEGQNIILLGGNQSNAVTQQSFPKQQVLSYRWPRAEDRLGG